MIDTRDLKYGFWVGMGLLLAFLTWHMISALISRSRGNG